MNIKDIIKMLPCNDRGVFIDTDGFFHERIGIGWLNDKYNTECFLSEEGYWYEIESSCDQYVGKVGDTVTLKDISYSFRKIGSGVSPVKDASRYLHVDTSNLNDTVKLIFDTMYRDKFQARLYMSSNTFPVIEDRKFDLSAEDYCIGDEYHKYNLKDIIIWPLIEYSRCLGKKVNVEVYFQKWINVFSEEEKSNKCNDEIYHLEEMFLPRLRRYIKEELDKAWDEFLNNKGIEEFLAKEEELRLKYRSKYDQDPNLM